MLKPFPKLDDDASMLKLGRLHALRDARFDALAQLRDAVTQLNSSNEEIWPDAINRADEALKRLRELESYQAPDTGSAGRIKPDLSALQSA